MTEDERWMQRCLHLARNGAMGAPPNPLVGAVIVSQGTIIGEGFHQCYGGPHAEVNAIASVTDKDKLSHATLYVNLEPCAHFGKTPPCCDLLISYKIQRVVVGMVDPFAAVHGEGIARMRAAGIDVTVGVCEVDCQRLNRYFVTSQCAQRPYVTLKWAQSANAYIDIQRAALSEQPPQRLSTKHSLLHVHQLRATHDAILIGHHTAVLDDPTLNVRHWVGKSPLRVVLTPHRPLPSHLRLLQDGLPTLVIGPPSTHVHDAVIFIPMPCQEHGVLHIDKLLSLLYQHGVRRLLVEGGAQVHQHFFYANLWDEAWVEHADTVIKKGVAAPQPSTHAIAMYTQSWGMPITHYINTHPSISPNRV